jgi:drug/metabolite transporter (DMT)-like permease
LERAPDGVRERRDGVAVLLALASAVLWGGSDFLGGLASRRATSQAVVFGSQASGLVVLLLLLPWLGGAPSASDLWLGAAAGASGGAGLVIFYRAMAAGVMSVIAPTTGVCAAAVPVLTGLALGERIGVAAAVGIVLALVAVLLVAAEGGLSSLRAVRPASLVPALTAGVLFGLFFVLLHRTHPAAELAPLVSARAASVLLVGAAALATGRSLRVPRRALLAVAAAGVGDMTANALYLVATQHGQLAITVLLAQVVLRERLVRTQVAGLVAAVAAVVLIAVPA